MTDVGPARAAGVRARVREEMYAELLDAARQRLATDGPTGLSLRAVARDIGVASSAVYRYVPSRDALLTALIVEAYDDLGAAAEHSEGEAARQDHLGRFLAACRGTRGWALTHPHRWALLFGSPVTGYAAPQDTVGPAARIPALLVGIVSDALEAGRPLPDHPVDAPLRAAMAPVLEFFGAGIPEETVLRGLMTYTYLNGVVSAELFGHRHNVVADPVTVFEAEMIRAAGLLGLS